MRKFKVLDNTTFIFDYTFKNLKAFCIIKRNLTLMLLSVLLIFIGSIGIFMHTEEYSSLKQYYKESVSVEEQKIVIEEKLEEENLSEEEIKILEDEFEVLIVQEDDIFDKSLGKLKSSIPVFIIIGVLFLLYSIINIIFHFEWMRFYFKSKFCTSVLKNIIIMIKIFCIYFVYLTIPVFLLLGLNTLFFKVKISAGAYTLLLWIPFLAYYIKVFSALALKYTSIVLDLKSDNIINLMNKTKGNALRFIVSIWLVTAVFYAVRMIFELIMSGIVVVFGYDFLFIAFLFISTLMLVFVRGLITFVLLGSFYKAMIDKEEQFLK